MKFTLTTSTIIFLLQAAPLLAIPVPTPQQPSEIISSSESDKQAFFGPICLGHWSVCSKTHRPSLLPWKPKPKRSATPEPAPTPDATDNDDEDDKEALLHPSLSNFKVGCKAIYPLCLKVKPKGWPKSMKRTPLPAPTPELEDELKKIASILQLPDLNPESITKRSPEPIPEPTPAEPSTLDDEDLTKLASLLFDLPPANTKRSLRIRPVCKSIMGPWSCYPDNSPFYPKPKSKAKRAVVAPSAGAQKRFLWRPICMGLCCYNSCKNGLPGLSGSGGKKAALSLEGLLRGI